MTLKISGEKKPIWSYFKIQRHQFSFVSVIQNNNLIIIKYRFYLLLIER